MASPQKRKQSRIKRAATSVDPEGIGATKDVFGLAAGMLGGLMGMFKLDPRLAPEKEMPADENPPNSDSAQAPRQRGRRRQRRKTRTE